jgi:hypothetical protein
MLVDDSLPTYDVSDAVAVVVDADVPTTWAALMEVDLIDLLHGETPPSAPERLVLRDTAGVAGGNWILLGERSDDEIALGLAGKFWRPVIEYAQVAPADFRDFTEPGYAKTVYSLSVRPLDGGSTLLSAVMRTATTDEHARRWFRRYWTFGVGSGAHVLAAGLAEAARDAAEASIRQPPGGTHV